MSCGVCGAPALAAEAVAWLQQFPGPVRVACEAGPTGLWAGACVRGGGIAGAVAARRDPAVAYRRVTTDRRDAERLARLLRLGEPVAVRGPEPHDEAARDSCALTRMCAVS